ncbi:UNVERIFIED_CONTAM: Retrovirus-related Pol polyprotein from transposon.6 [Sesamum radiatum]|uniref:Retrovirus-related Pol polyprotein from transposon.6 n=1 Tax=Sesamum radiatum TaxID=300843 RepID=A0AAW2U7Q1_SESRA
MFAISEAVRKWRQYLLGRKFHIYTDHHSLRGLLQQTIQTPAQQKWLTKLLGYDFDIHYTPGKDNRVADALSRMPPASALMFTTVSLAVPDILEQLRRYYQDHVDGRKLVLKLAAQEHSPLKFSESNG